MFQVYIEFGNILYIQEYNRVAISGGGHDFMFFCSFCINSHFPPIYCQLYSTKLWWLANECMVSLFEFCVNLHFCNILCKQEYNRVAISGGAHSLGLCTLYESTLYLPYCHAEVKILLCLFCIYFLKNLNILWIIQNKTLVTSEWVWG